MRHWLISTCWSCRDSRNFMADRAQFLIDYIRFGAKRKTKFIDTYWSPCTTLWSVLQQWIHIRYSGTVFFSRISDSVVMFLVICYAILVVPTVSNRLSFKDQRHISFGFFSWRSANSPLINSIGWFLQEHASVSFVSLRLDTGYWWTDYLNKLFL